MTSSSPPVADLDEPAADSLRDFSDDVDEILNRDELESMFSVNVYNKKNVLLCETLIQMSTFSV